MELWDSSFCHSFILSVSRITHECINRRRPNMVGIDKGWPSRSSSSSRMRVMNHNWSTTKQRLHPQSIAEISRHSVLSRDRIRQCETSSLLTLWCWHGSKCGSGSVFTLLNMGRWAFLRFTVTHQGETLQRPLSRYGTASFHFLD